MDRHNKQALMMAAAIIAQGRMAMMPAYDKPLTSGQVSVITHDSIIVAEALMEKIDAKYPDTEEESEYKRWADKEKKD